MPFLPSLCKICIYFSIIAICQAQCKALVRSYFQYNLTMKKILLLVICTVVSCIPSLLAQDTENTDFYDTNEIREFKVSFEQNNWQDLLDSMRLYGDGVLIGAVEIDGKRYEDVGIRYDGRRSNAFGKGRKPLHVELDFISKNQNHEGYEVFKLSNALRDPSMVREVLSYEIARKYMPAPKANFAKVSINGQTQGLFVNVQAVDEVFLKENFGSADNSFFKCSPEYKDNESMPSGCKKNLHASLEYESKASCYTRNFRMVSREGWDDLISLTNTLNNKTEDIESILHVDRTLWMLAFNNALVNLSSYSGQNSRNFFLYRDDLGRFNPIISGLNLSFGSYKNTGSGSDLRLKQLQQLSPVLHADNPTKPLISKLLADPLYRKVYLSHLRTILYDNFENDWYEERAEALQELIRPHLVSVPDDWKEYKMEDFDKSLSSTIGRRSKIPGIVELMGKRSRFLKKHELLSVFPPKVEEVTVKGREKFSNEIIRDFKVNATVEKRAKRVILYYRYEGETAFRETFMADDGQHHDGEAGDKIFGVTIKPDNGQKRIEYFILAENIAAAAFAPVNYMYEPYSSDLEDLNK